MRRKVAILLFLVVVFVGAGIGVAQQNTVLRVYIHGEVDPVMARYVERSVARAESQGMKAIVLDINTPGGRIDAALDISQALMQTAVPTIAVVTGQAWSAGTLIALSAREIYLFPGASMGAAEPMPRTEKIVSAWRGAMEAAAESGGRSTELAAAMVDSDLKIPGVVDTGKLLTLSARKAVELGMADEIANNVQGALAVSTVGSGAIEDSLMTSTEETLRFLTQSRISTLLMVIGIVGITLEIISAGFGFPGVIGLIAFGLFFGGTVMSGQASQIVLLVFGLGVVLLAIEAFAAGFGVAGFAGIILVLASLVLAAGDTAEGLRMVTVAGAISIALLAVLWRFLAKRNVFEKISLQGTSTADKGYLSSTKEVELIGAPGVAVTPLRPSGTVEISGRRYSVVTEGVFVAAGQEVVVTKVDGGRVVVKPQQTV